MKDIPAPFETFIEDPAPPGQKRGPLLCQPPPSLTFDVRALDYALRTGRAADEGQTTIEAQQKAGRRKRQLTCRRHTRLTGFSPIPRSCGLSKLLANPYDMFVYTEIPKSIIPPTAAMRRDRFQIRSLGRGARKCPSNEVRAPCHRARKASG
nr:hypothetical protein [Agrobacterium tumefaciens]